MGIYKVQSNGFAPVGLKTGDQVVTGGGTYLITNVKADGSYDSLRMNPNQTTYNYSGSYDAAPLIGANAGSLRVTEDNVKEVFSQKLGHTVQDSYTPVVKPETKVEAMSFADAVKLAEQVMQPRYEESFRRTASDAAQRLERVGLYDTLYGQALAADAERDVAAELNNAVHSLALELSQNSSDQALDLLKLAVTENQYGKDYQASQGNTALKYLYQMIKDMEAREAALLKD
ncbi:MAG: hypothetical protein IJP07_00190 [Firmicutes bacterium]|nr:hypothetical protein [Bacillota bacterium]